MASIRRGYAAQNKRLGILNPDLQSLDRSMNKDSWGNSPSFLQGSMSSGADPLIQMGIDDKAKKKFLAPTNLNSSDSTSLEDVGTGFSNLYDKASSGLSGLFSSDKENTMNEITNPAFRNLDHATQSALNAEMAGKNEGDEEGRQMAQWKQLEGPSGPTGLPNNLLSTPEAKIDTEGESALDRIGRDNMLNERLGPDSLDGGESVDERSLWEKTKGLFSSDSDDEDEYKPLSKGKQAAVKLATNLLTAKDDPIQNAPSAGVKMGRAAFPNLLASSRRPVNPRYTPKGLG